MEVRMDMRFVITVGAMAVTVAPAIGTANAQPGNRPQEPARSVAHEQTIYIPAGEYEPLFRGVKGTRRPVAAFEMGASYVTRAQYLEFVRNHPRWRKSRAGGLFAEDTYMRDWPDDLDPGNEAHRPVTFVSWFAASAYCEASGGRLPSVAEWERVAGLRQEVVAGDVGDARPVNAPFRFAMGAVAPELRHTGLRVGELWEWSSDFNSSLVSARSDGSGSDGSLFCGDGYRATNPSDYGAFLRYSFRSSLRANYALRNLGFRCVRPAT
jgi:sulfatase modifying factor 1